MRIQEMDGDIIDIFAMYWIKGEGYFWGLPKNYGGLLTFRASEVKVIDHELKGKWIFVGNGVFHWALMDKNLLGNLSELDYDSYKHFLKILKTEGQIEEGFY